VRELLAHFRSIDAIQLATVEQIAAAPGMGPALAGAVWDYFHPHDGHRQTEADAIEPEDGPLADLAS
jgi:excinuclease ABC subunit C